MKKILGSLFIFALIIFLPAFVFSAKNEEQNQVRIKKLQKIQEQVSNQKLQKQIQETLKVLEKQNTALGEQITQEEKRFNLWGWFKNLFAK